MKRAIKIAAISLVTIVAVIFALYCKAGFFDYLWVGGLWTIVPLAIGALIGWALDRWLIPLIRNDRRGY